MVALNVGKIWQPRRKPFISRPVEYELKLRCLTQKNRQTTTGYLWLIDMEWNRHSKNTYLRRLHGGVEEHVDFVVRPVLGVHEKQEVGDPEQGEEDESGPDCLLHVSGLGHGGRGVLELYLRHHDADNVDQNQQVNLELREEDNQRNK